MQQEAGYAAGLDEIAVPEGPEVAQVGEAAVGDGETEQPGDDEHERDPVPTAALGEDADADGGDDHVADGIGEPTAWEKTLPEPEWYTVPSAVVQLTINSEPTTMQPSRSSRAREMPKVGGEREQQDPDGRHRQARQAGRHRRPRGTEP